MSWIEQLYQTYENSFGKPSSQNDKKPLLPLFHTLKKAHIDVYIDGKGNYIRANIINNGEEIIIPCTEDSSGRTSGEAPHPLCEKLQYCAKDYKDFGGKKESYFNSYLELIGKWKNSDDSYYIVDSVYNYIQKGSLTKDLIESRILITDDNGKLVSNWPKDEEKPDILKLLNPKKEKGNDNQTIDQGDLFIRWNVEVPEKLDSACWKSSNLIDKWISISAKNDSIEDFCYVIGEMKPVAISHSKRIRNGKDGAKLISSNDSDGFTFRGRFLSANQSVTVSAEISHKAHSALRWLIEKQGYSNGDQVFIAWAVSGKEIPDPFIDSLSLLDETKEDMLAYSEGYFNIDTGQTFVRKLNKRIAGYSTTLNNSNNIVVLGLDSASKGRLSITFYRELKESEFFKRINNWHIQMAWHLRCYHDKKNKKIIWGYFLTAPSPEAIAEACYGTKRDADFKKFKKTIIERFLPCIIDGRQIPIDIVETAVHKASNRLAYKDNEKWQWEQALSVACALYRCYSIRNINNKNKYTMALENGRTDRDYLYGRLLAVAEHIEETALRIAKENRDTTASRLMQRFSDYPFSTWRSIELALKPYESRILSNKWGAGFLVNKRKLIDEIHSKFESVEDYKKDSRLSGLYLLGYHCQRLELKAKKQDEEKEIEINQ